MLNILNDVHIGFHRVGGTTPSSQMALRNYLLSSFVGEVDRSADLVIMGDLFDAFEVSPEDWVDTYVPLAEHVDNGGGLILVAGNHDWSPKGNRMSSFEMLATVLCHNHRDDGLHVVEIDTYLELVDDIFVAHCSSQAIFEEKLKEILAKVRPGVHVFLHANYDNNFAAQSDHSLNVSREVAKEFHAKGAVLVFAHEHQARTDPGVGVVVMGNQWPTSIYDCLGNTKKCAWIRDSDGMAAHKVTWQADGEFGYREVNWRDLGDLRGVKGFLRIVGTASANEAGDVITAVAQFRKSALDELFVVSNGVKVAGITEAQDLPDTFEVAKKFDVMNYVKEHLDPEEIKVVESLLKE